MPLAVPLHQTSRPIPLGLFELDITLFAFRSSQESCGGYPPTPLLLSNKPISTMTSRNGHQDPDVAMKTRIITHMNSSHQSSLQNYLQHYNRVPASSTYDAQMDDVSLTHMSITCSMGRYMIPFDPPMKSLMEARERTVVMHKVSLAALGKSDTEINEYRYPKGIVGWGMPILTIWAVQLMAQSTTLQPGGSLIFDYVLDPWAPRWFVSFAQVGRLCILLGMIAVHVGETVWFWRTRLEKYNVKRFGAVWWKWLITSLCSGFPIFERFDEVVHDVEQKGLTTH